MINITRTIQKVLHCEVFSAPQSRLYGIGDLPYVLFTHFSHISSMETSEPDFLFIFMLSRTRDSIII